MDETVMMDAMLPCRGSTSKFVRGFRSISGAGLVAIVLGIVPASVSAQAVQTVTATNDLSCLGSATRGNGNQTLSCTAKDFATQATLTADPNTPAFCQAGQSFTLSANVEIAKGGGGDSYDIGFFAAQNANDPAGPGTCSVATFVPVTSTPFSDLGGNTCSDFSGKFTATATVQNIKVVCSAAGPTDANLAVPYLLSWSSGTTTCSGPSNVTASPQSKCRKNTTTTVSVGTQNLQVGGYVDVTKQTTPDGETQSFSYTATGASGSMVGYQVLAGGAPTGNVITNNSNSVAFSLADGQAVRVFMSVVAANRTLNIVESATTHWSGTAAISCAAVTGSPVLATNDGNRSIAATLNTTNSAAACTVVNTKRARVSLVENVAGRLYAADQFEFSVAGAGAALLTTDTTGALLDANLAKVTTSGTGTGAFTNPTHPGFRATPGVSLSLSSAMAAGSTSTSASYDTTLTCTNAFTGPGATTSLPTAQAVSTYALVPQPGDNITCTYTNTPRALLTLAKVVVNDNGRTATATAWTLGATGPTNISGVSGSVNVTAAPVAPGTYVLAESGPAGYAASLACTGAADTDPSDGLALASGEIASCTFTNDDLQVAQTVVKNGVLEQDPDGSGSVTEGDTLRYTVTVTNTGVVPLTNVVVDDPSLTPGTQACASVAVGATCVLSGTYVVTAADAAASEVVNTASVASNEIPGPVPSNTVTMPVQAAMPGELAVAKSHSGDFAAGSNASYTLQVSNTGNTAINGTTTLQDTLATGLAFVSATGAGWSCGAAGQLVTCTSTDSVPAYGNMPAITLVVAVAGSIGNSVDNAASVGNSSVNGGAMAAGNTDTATVLHPDLSTSTKGVVDLNGGDVETGDVLEYRINLVESAGAAATDVSVTDTLQAGLDNLQVTQVPGGGTDNSTAGQVSVVGITVPANGSLQLLFEVTVGAGFTPGDTIDNTAVIDNPGGPDAAPAARTLVFDQSSVGGSGNKILYLHDDLTLDRTPQAGTTTTGVLVEAGTSDAWVLAPAIPAGESLVLSAGAIGIEVPVSTNFSQVELQAQLIYRPSSGPDLLIGSSAIQSFATGAGAEERAFVVNLAADYTVPAGGQLILRILNSANGNKHARIYEYNGTPATITFATSTVVTVDSVQAYSQAFADGNAQSAYYVHGDLVWIRAVTSDPFGGGDVSAAELTLTDPYGNPIVVSTPMAIVDTTGGSRTFEYATTVPDLVSIGMWTASVTAHEGTEGTVDHTANGQLEVRGRVTLQHTWDSGSQVGDSVTLQIAGGSDPVAGSSTATSTPGPTPTPATAAATATATLTLDQSFTTGLAGNYTVAMACKRDGDDAAVASTGVGLSRQVQMPLDSSITCTWTNAPTVSLAVLKWVVVRSDPVNGSTNPKAIPGAILEYQVRVTNPGGVVDSDSVQVSDPLPVQTEFLIEDINGSGSGSGPVRFTDSATDPSGLAYSYPADIVFSSNNGSTWDYVPSDPDADGIDPNVTDIRINPKGDFVGAGANFTLSFRVRLK